MSDLIQEARERAMRKALNDSDLRIFLWDHIETDCLAFARGYAHNATAYSMLAKQQVGKELLADLKAVDLRQVFRAEAEYRQLVEQNNEARRTENGE